MARTVRSVVVYENLRDKILRGELGAGDRLITRRLAQSLGTSDIPVREALWMLARDGLVEMQAYSGARVASLSRDEILEVLVVRGHLEGLATRLAAERIDAAGLSELRDLISRQEVLAASPELDPLEYAELNRQFHRVIFEHSGNARLVDLIASVWEGHSNLQTVFRLFPDRLQRSIGEHRAIYRALASGNGDLAGRLATEHKLLQQQDLLVALDREPAGITGLPGANA